MEVKTGYHPPLA